MNEISTWSHVCMVQYPDAWQTIQDIEHYTPTQKTQAAAEVAFFHYNNHLPDWAIIIQAVEIVDGSAIFVHTEIR